MYNRKKGVDKGRGVCYTVQAVSERHSPSERKATVRTLKTIQRMIEKFFGACEDRRKLGASEEGRAGERPANSQIRRVKRRMIKRKRGQTDKGLNIRV